MRCAPRSTSPGPRRRTVLLRLAGPTPPRMSSDDAFELLVQAIAPAVAYARERGVRLAIETSSTSTRDLGFVHSLADAVELARATPTSGCASSSRTAGTTATSAALFREHVDRFALVQVNDFTVGDGARLNRRVPGDGDMPVEWLLGELLDAGLRRTVRARGRGPADRGGGLPRRRSTRGLEWISERLGAGGRDRAPLSRRRGLQEPLLGFDERVAHRAPAGPRRRRPGSRSARPSGRSGRRPSAGTRDRTRRGRRRPPTSSSGPRPRAHRRSSNAARSRCAATSPRGAGSRHPT